MKVDTMEQLKTLYLKLDLDKNIIEHTNNFLDLFGVNRSIASNSFFGTIVNDPTQTEMFQEIFESQTPKSVLLFKNFKAQNNDGTIILYTNVTKTATHYNVIMTNWLNWIHNINGSLECGYNSVESLNNQKTQSEFERLSDIACYKALSPLLSHTPRKLMANVCSEKLYEIMRLFVKKRSFHYSKDFGRDVYSRLRTNIRKDLGLISHDPHEILYNNNLLNFKHDGQIYIPDTTVVSDICLKIEPDHLLNMVISNHHMLSSYA